MTPRRKLWSCLVYAQQSLFSNNACTTEGTLPRRVHDEVGTSTAHGQMAAVNDGDVGFFVLTDNTETSPFQGCSHGLCFGRQRRWLDRISVLILALILFRLPLALLPHPPFLFQTPLLLFFLPCLPLSIPSLIIDKRKHFIYQITLLEY